MVSPNSAVDGTEFWDVRLSQSIIWECYGPEVTGPTDAVNITARYKELGSPTEIDRVLALARPSVDPGQTSRGTFTLSTTALALFGTSDGPVQIRVVSSKTDAIRAVGVVDWILGAEQRDDPFEPNNSIATASNVSFRLDAIPAAVLADPLTMVDGEIASVAGRRITELDKLSNDYYVVDFGEGLSVSRGGILTVQIDGFDHDLNDLNLTLFNMSGYRDFSRKSQPGGGSNVERITTYVDPNNGPYYILVDGEPTLGAERYTLHIQVTEHTMAFDPIPDGIVGGEIPVVWRNFGNGIALSDIGTKVKIELSIDGGSVYEIRLDPSHQNRSDAVTLPFSPRPDMVSTAARLRITDLATSATAVSDPFEISAPSASDDYLLITSPVPGDEMQVASAYVIEWITSVSGGEVNIYFSDDGVPSGGWTPDYYIAKGTENDGQYTLRVPNEVTSEAVIHIEIAADPSICDTMDGTFSIITYSPAGKIVATNEPTELTFTAYDNGVLLNGLVAGYSMPRIKVENSGNDTLNYRIEYSSTPEWLAAPSPLTGAVNLTSTYISLSTVGRSELAALGIGAYFGQVVMLSDDVAVEPVTKYVRMNIIESTLTFRNAANDLIERLPAAGAYVASMSDTVAPISDTLRIRNAATNSAAVTFSYELFEAGSTVALPVNNQLVKIDISGSGAYTNLTDYSIAALPAGATAQLRLGIDAHDAVLTPNRSEERRVGKECRSRWRP